MTIGSLCSGYGGLDMAAGAVFADELAWWADLEPGPIAVMTRHHPGLPNLGDIKTVDWESVPPVRILTAGYPCQPFSNAGKRLGTEDPRHLWPYVAAAIGTLRPELIVLENVAAHLRRGFDIVCEDLADLGYDAVWTTVRASAVGAPHRRERLFVLATADTGSASGDITQHPEPGSGRAPKQRAAQAKSGGLDSSPADALRGGRRRNEGDAGRGAIQRAAVDGNRPGGLSGKAAADTLGEPLRKQSRRRGGSGGSGAAGPGFSGEIATDFGPYQEAVDRWETLVGRPAPEPTTTGARGARVLNPVFVEWMMGLPDGYVTGTEGLSRNALLKLLGNGVVPQQAEYALRQLLELVVLAA